MSDRVCAGCGTPEVRQVIKGRLEINLEPSTGYCVPCLATMARESRPLPPDPPDTRDVFDPRAAAANDTRDR